MRISLFPDEFEFASPGFLNAALILKNHEREDWGGANIALATLLI